MNDYRTITSFELACADQGFDPAAILPDVSKMPESLASLGRSAVAFVKLCVIRDSINKDENGKVVKANWYDTDERKWSNFMEVEATEECPSGVGLSVGVAGYDNSGTDVPARLTCIDEPRSEFFFNEHKALWEEYILHRD